MSRLRRRSSFPNLFNHWLSVAHKKQILPLPRPNSLRRPEIAMFASRDKAKPGWNLQS